LRQTQLTHPAPAVNSFQAGIQMSFKNLDNLLQCLQVQPEKTLDEKVDFGPNGQQTTWNQALGTGSWARQKADITVLISLKTVRNTARRQVIRGLLPPPRVAIAKPVRMHALAVHRAQTVQSLNQTQKAKPGHKTTDLAVPKIQILHLQASSAKNAINAHWAKCTARWI